MIPTRRSNRRSLALGALLAALALSSLAAAPCRADRDPWAPGSNWLYVRGGYAKSGADGAGNGGAGYGFGFRHMLAPSKVDEWAVFGRKPLPFVHWTLFKHWSFGGFAEYDVLGRYGSAEEIEIPVALDLTRHLGWKGVARPYFSLGFGPFYRKTYGTGADFGRIALSGFVGAGFDAHVAPGQLLGIDARMARVDSENKPANPVFGSGQTESGHWSVKVAYSLAY